MATKPQSWFEIKAVQDGTAEIYIYDEIGLFGVSANDFVKSFKSATRGASRVDLHINSPGGDVSDGFAIYNTLRGSKKTIHTYNDGWAVSIASYLLQAGDKRYVAENSLTMLHNPWALTVGDANDMRKTAEVLDKHRNAMLTAYAEKSGKTEDEMKAILDADSWFEADEAVEEGFADEVYKPEDAVKAYARARFKPQAYQAKYRNLRPEFLSAVSVDDAPAGDDLQETPVMGDSKKEEPKGSATNDSADAEAVRAQVRAELKAEMKARGERIRAAAFPGQEELAQKLIDGDDTIEAAVLALNADAKTRATDILAGFQKQSDKVEHRNEGDPDAAEVPAQEETLEQTMVLVYRKQGHPQDEAVRLARAFVSR